MLPPLYLGIVARDAAYEIAALERGQHAVRFTFPGTAAGREALSIVLLAACRPIRLAIAGIDAVDLALKLGNTPGRSSIALDTRVDRRAEDLAHYAIRFL